MVSNKEIREMLKVKRESCLENKVLKDSEEKTEDNIEMMPNIIPGSPSKIVKYNQKTPNFKKLNNEDFKSMKKFDLNIEKILENWEVYHGVREIIANAIDEQILTGSKDIKIFKDGNNRWHIHDYGRGLKYEHLTQNER